MGGVGGAHVNAYAIGPVGRTRMTEGVFADMMKAPEGGFDAMAPESVSPMVVLLGSEGSLAVNGRLFEVFGGKIILSDGWRPGATADKGGR